MRAVGVAAAALWIAVALWGRAEWPRAGLVALAVAVVAALALRPVASALPRVVMAPPRPVFVGACALVAAGLSWWVLRTTMGDQVLSIDAGVYVMQARAMAHGHFGMPAPLPAQAFSDRFLLEGPDRLLYGIFPPGWPLAIVPFVWLGAPTIAGPLLAALLVVAQAALGRAVGRAAGDEDGGELAMRVSLLVSLPSVGRVLETADLLSHAFVAVLATLAVAIALGVVGEGKGARRSPDASRARLAPVLLGACAGWVLAARLLDGVVLALLLGGVLAWRRAAWTAFAWAALGAAPFVALLAVEQRFATGAWALPTQSLYFARSDWPPTCHRLGFGRDVGCTVEHHGTVARMGGDGYDLHDALAVLRERSGAVGQDLLGFPPLVLLAFVPVVVGGSLADATLLAFVLALTLSYALFYYGNAMFFGARHLFPAAPFVWLLAARGAARAPARRRGWLDAPHARGGAAAVLLAVAVVAVIAPWKERTRGAAGFQAERSDLRRAFAKHGVERGILKSHDLTSVAAAFDPWADGNARFFVLEDGSGQAELRRGHPELPVFVSLPHEQLGKLYASRPPAGLLVELDRAWPTFVRPDGLATRQATQDGASGGVVLLLSHAHPGARVSIPFDVSVGGEYEVRVGAAIGPDQGDYALDLDGLPLPDWHGYAAVAAMASGAPRRLTLAAGRHVLVARCAGRDPASTDWNLRLDTLVGQ